MLDQNTRGEGIGRRTPRPPTNRRANRRIRCHRAMLPTSASVAERLTDLYFESALRTTRIAEAAPLMRGVSTPGKQSPSSLTTDEQRRHRNCDNI